MARVSAMLAPAEQRGSKLGRDENKGGRGGARSRGQRRCRIRWDLHMCDDFSLTLRPDRVFGNRRLIRLGGYREPLPECLKRFFDLSDM